MQNKIRLNKYIANCGIASRREADKLIQSGVVEVNGKKVGTPGVSVSSKDIVKINGKVIREEKKEYVAFHKPPGYITTRDDEKKRKTIYSILPDNMKNLKPAGRLDKDSTGLIILTNDGELIQKLTHPKRKVPKIYRVVAKGKLNKDILIKLLKGIEIEKGKIAYAESVILDYGNGETTLNMVLYQGYNRQIRRMLDIVGFPVLSLKRISHASINIDGIDRGKFRYLKPKEIKDLNNYLKKIENK